MIRRDKFRQRKRSMFANLLQRPLHQKFGRPFIILLALIVCCGCRTIKQSPQTEVHVPKTNLINQTQSRILYTNSPRHTFTFTEKLNPGFWFGNADDPDPPESYKPADPNRRRKWYWRNSCHNFTFYVMGISDKEFVRSGRVPHKVFNPEGGWNWAVCKYKCVRLPFISYQRGDFKFYIGWRERGNFGIKLTF